MLAGKQKPNDLQLNVRIRVTTFNVFRQGDANFKRIARAVVILLEGPSSFAPFLGGPVQSTVSWEGETMQINLELDHDDFDAIQRAMSRRQGVRLMTRSQSNLAGRLVAEICRTWCEWIDEAESDDDGTYQ